MSRTRMTVMERIRARTSVVVGPLDTPCWVWTGALSPKGYGVITLRTNGRKLTRRVHGVAYTELVGPVPEGLQLDHLCVVPACWNPEHLEPVTGRVNWERSSAPSRLNALKVACLRGHPLDETNTYRFPRGRRACRICRADHDRRRRAAKAVSA